MISSEIVILICGVVACTGILLCWFVISFQALLRHVKKQKQGDISYVENLPTVSVIVYASNDADDIVSNLSLILSQDYPEFEVIVVVDSHSDRYRDLISDMTLNYRNLYQTFVPQDTCNLSRKKLSITLGLKAAKHDIVICTAANCIPSSNQWLKMMARNFTPKTDIVIGVAHNQYPRRKDIKTLFASFDSVMSAIQYVSYAIRKKAYRGDGNNLAYRKDVFFNNKGFSRSLNLHFGDDDLFINEVANSNNTRVEISPESQMTVGYKDFWDAYDELKLRYGFTARYLRTSAIRLWAFMSAIYYINTLLVVFGAIIYYSNILVMAIILPLWIMINVIQIIYYSKVAKILQAPKLLFTIPFFSIIRPIVNLKYNIKGYSSRKNNYTWQRRK